jgi:SAM-dependent methyltransferase
MRRCLRCEHLFASEGWRCSACGHEPPTVRGFTTFAPELQADDIGYDATRFEALARVESQHFWFASRSRLIVWALGRHFPRARHVLEVGCGTGNVLAALGRITPKPRLLGAEAHAAGLAFAARRAGDAELVQMDARRIPFRDELDVIGAFDVIEHIDDDERVLGEMFAACRPGGGVMITVPQHEWLWSYRDEFAHHRRRYRRRDLLAKLAAAGFERPWSTSFVTLPLPLMALSRLRQRGPETFDAEQELDLGRVTNGLLGALMAIERGLIRLGISLPLGGSLLVTAHKPGEHEGVAA